MSLRYQLTHEDRIFCEKVVAAGNHAVKHSTLQIVEDLLDDGVPGDFAECGVMGGAHPAIMLRSLKRRGITDRKVHLFDSFQGIPRATVDDSPSERETYGMSTGEMASSGISSCSVDQVVYNLKQWGAFYPELFVLHPGWFQETLPRFPPSRRLALLRSDVDLYESTKCVYRLLYGNTAAGGYVIDDDYGTPACRRALEEVIGSQEVTHVEGQDTTVWWRKP